MEWILFIINNGTIAVNEKDKTNCFREDGELINLMQINQQFLIMIKRTKKCQKKGPI